MSLHMGHSFRKTLEDSIDQVNAEAADVCYVSVVGMLVGIALVSICATILMFGGLS